MGLAYLRAYLLRNAPQVGIDVKVHQELLGHADIPTHEGRYTEQSTSRNAQPTPRSCVGTPGRKRTTGHRPPGKFLKSQEDVGGRYRIRK